EIAEIVAIIRRIRDDGVTVLLIEHVMQAVMSLGDHAYVLNDGRIIAAGTPPPPGSGRQPVMAEAALLEIAGLAAGYGMLPVLRDIDMQVMAGEIIAVLGANGAGKSTLNKTVSGLIRASTGSIRFAGTEITRADPAAIVAAGLLHVPEGRRVFPNLAV